MGTAVTLHPTWAGAPACMLLSCPAQQCNAHAEESPITLLVGRVAQGVARGSNARGGGREASPTSEHEAVAAAIHCMSHLIRLCLQRPRPTPFALPIHSLGLGFARLSSRSGLGSVAHEVALPFLQTPLASQIPPVAAHSAPQYPLGATELPKEAWPPCMPLRHSPKHLLAHSLASHARCASVRSPAGSAGATGLGSSDLCPR